MITRTRILLVSLMILFLGCLWWISTKVTVDTIQVRTPPSEDILNNPMAALQHLLINLGIEAESHRDRKLLHNLPSTEDALIVRNLIQPLTEERETALIEWVAEGGRLIYEPFWLGSGGERAYLHEKMGVLVNQTYSDEDAESEDDEYEYEVHAQTKIDNETIFVHFLSDYYLTLEAEDIEVVATSKVGIHAARVYHGKGEILFITDSDFLNTPRAWSKGYGEDGFSVYGLPKHDHAYFIWTQLKDRKKVWILHETLSPAFLSVIYQHFPMFSIFGLTWLTLFFFYLLKRFGPIIKHEDQAQRDLSQHLLQAGLYHWQHDKANTLLSQWRSRIEKRLLRRHPHLAGYQQDEFFHQLSIMCHISAPLLKSAMSEPCRNENEFLQFLKSLKTLWTI